MIEIHDTTDFRSDVPSAVTLGKFDGFHRGHQKLLREVLRLQDLGYYGIAFTIAPEDAQVLLTVEEKRDFLEESGIDCMIRCPFVPEILNMEPEEFVSGVLVERLKARCVVVGTDFRFGRRRRGDVRLLGQLQGRYGFRLIVMEKERYGEREISSTYVKEALARADMELVRELLGREYPVTGLIAHGRQLGRTIGVPTVNQVPDPRKLLPPYGVYFSDVTFDGRICHGMTNIGCKPTADGSFAGVETYLYGVDEDLYGRRIRVSLRAFRRPERKFASVDELQAQMQRDIEAGKAFFGKE